MNFILVRTKLQAVIALELIRTGRLGPRFVFFPLYQFEAGEDDASVGRLYAQISRAAVATIPITQSRGLIRSSLLLALALLCASLTRGQFHAAVIDYYALALALKLVPFACFNGFDDGTANTQPATKYRSDLPLAGDSLKRRIARALFPQGSAAFCRSRICLHYSIYRGRGNVVPAEKLRFVQPDWSSLLSASDVARLSVAPRTVLLGTVYEDHKGTTWRSKLEWASERCDAYLPHPREKGRPSEPRNVLVLDAPAESVIHHWIRMSPAPITVMHFNSSVADSFVGDDRVTFVDLLSMDVAG